jgi:pimeloyl-ACP methyl ester carboxylesterase
VPEVSDHTGELDGQPVFWRSAPATGTPTLYVHGVPTNSDDWVPFLQRTGGVAPDLPGFGRSGKRGDLDFTMVGYDRFLERFLALVDLPRVNLLVHDWGAVGLLWAQRFPERVESLVVMNAVPLLPGYRWHRIARIWRTPGLGELFMGGTNRATTRLVTRNATPRPGPMPDAFIDSVIAHLDQGTQRAILRLYRSSPPDALAAAGTRLDTLASPALVVWGDRDPYIPPRFAEAYAEALPDARVVHLPDAGHWPWFDRPDLIGIVSDHLVGS